MEGRSYARPAGRVVVSMVLSALGVTPVKLRRLVSRMDGWSRKVFERGRGQRKRCDGDDDRHV